MVRSTCKRVTAILLAFALLITGITMLEPMTVSAASSVKIGQATSGENGRIRDCKAGDQSGGEVDIGKWTYSSKSGAYNNWKYVIRAKDPAIAKKLAVSMTQACINNHIGYDQKAPDRFSCYDEAKKVGWDLSKITNNCETTCASVVSVCLNAAGIKTDRYWDSSLVYNDLKATGKFNIFTSKEFTASTDLLEAGDILVSPGHHTAMVVESPRSPGSSVKTAQSSVSTFKVGKEYQLTEELFVRTGAGKIFPAKTVSQLTENAKLYAIAVQGKAVLNKGTVVTCLKTNGDWIQIPSGWICGKQNGEYYITEYKDTAAQKAQYEKALTANKANTSSTVKPGTTAASKATAAATSTAVKATTTNTTTTKAATTTATAKATTTKTAAAKSSTLVIKKGRNYSLNMVLNVRTGPGLNYKNVKWSKLTADGKRHSTGSSQARLKKGTVVTCLEVRGNWMRIPSGWICCKPGNLSAAK